MNEPVFPQDFVENHCLQVKEARYWQKVFAPDQEPTEAKQWAECSFHSFGLFNMKCESCNMVVRDQYVDKIKQYYKDMKEYEQAQVLDYSI